MYFWLDLSALFSTQMACMRKSLKVLNHSVDILLAGSNHLEIEAVQHVFHVLNDEEMVHDLSSFIAYIFTSFGTRVYGCS